jgi:hypothetical protein
MSTAREALAATRQRGTPPPKLLDRRPGPAGAGRGQDSSVHLGRALFFASQISR